MIEINVSRTGFVLENMAEPGTGRIEMSKVANGYAESEEIDRSDGHRWKVGVYLHKASKSTFGRVYGAQQWETFVHVDTGDEDVIIVQDAMWLKYEEDAGWVEWTICPLSVITLTFPR